MKNNWLILFLLTSCLAGSLINSDLFGSPTLVACFVYSIGAALLATLVWLVSVKNGVLLSVSRPLPFILFMLLPLYYTLQGLCSRSGVITLRHYYLWADCLLFGSVSLLLGARKLRFLTVCILITLLAGVESVVCLLQFTGRVHSANNLFPISGTWVNPNVIAMFLAMSVPAMLLVYFEGGPLLKRMAVVVMIISLPSIFLLQCRTALIGTAIAAAIILNSRFNILHGLRQRFPVFILVLLAIFTVCLAGAAGNYFYRSKQASADGRAFVWKISLAMIAAKPVTGYGYGMFERDYNLAQARYIKNTPVPGPEISNASYVRMCYNEPLENAVEGGIIGCLLFAGLLAGMLLPAPLRKPDTSRSAMTMPVSFAGIAVFTVMSLFNFTVQAIPVACLFVLYAAARKADHMVLVYPAPARGSRSPQPLGWWLPAQKTALLVLAAGSLYLAMTMLLLANAYHAGARFKVGDDTGAAGTLDALEYRLRNSTQYWMSYGNFLFARRQYAGAMDKYLHAQKLSSNPDLYLQIGLCYDKMAAFDKAERACMVERYMEPNRFAPRFLLMNLYLDAKDTVQAWKTAKALIALDPKVPSGKVIYYKNEALHVLNRLSDCKQDK